MTNLKVASMLNHAQALEKLGSPKSSENGMRGNKMVFSCTWKENMKKARAEQHKQ